MKRCFIRLTKHIYTLMSFYVIVKQLWNTIKLTTQIVKYYGDWNMSIVLGAKFPDTIVNKVDNYVSKGSYLSRSDAVRDLIRRGLVSKAREDQEGVSAWASFLFFSSSQKNANMLKNVEGSGTTLILALKLRKKACGIYKRFCRGDILSYPAEAQAWVQNYWLSRTWEKTISFGNSHQWKSRPLYLMKRHTAQRFVKQFAKVGYNELR